MTYAETAYRPQGDSFLLVEFGDDTSLELNFRVLSLHTALKKTQVEGILETIPAIRSLGVMHDHRIISLPDLVKRLKQIETETSLLKRIPSRRVRIPVWYDDPWSVECARAFLDRWDHEYKGGCRSNIEYVAKLNGTTVEEVIRIVSSTEWWNAGVGFTPGVFIAVPLDPNYSIRAPTYRKPRTWTHDRILNTAGSQMSIYSIVSPGGYQLLGRTPWNTYEPTQSNAIFRDTPIFARAGDRYEFYPIDEAEYWRIRKEVDAGTCDYRANIREEEFDVQAYLNSVKRRKPET